MGDGSDPAGRSRNPTAANTGPPAPARAQPAPRGAPDLPGERARSGENRRDHGQTVGLVGQLELEVVDLPGQASVGIDDLAPEQFEFRPHSPAAGAAHDPAFVAIIRGIVAIATTV